MANKSYIPLETEEPYYYDFLYEEIRNNDESEILNTILFEALLRTDKMKNIYDLVWNYSANKLEETINSLADNKPLINPLKESIDDFIKKTDNLKNHLLEPLKFNDSNDEMMNMFFDNDKSKYETVVNSLKEIEQIVNEKILPNLKLEISLNFKENENKNTNYYELCAKYGLNFLQVADYLSKFKRFLDLASNFKNKLVNKQINISIYKQEINRYVKDFRSIVNKLFVGNKVIISLSRRPVLNLLTLLEFQIPYTINTTATMRIKKALDKLKKEIDERQLKEQTKYYLNFFKKNSLALAKDPENFSKILFIYDWIKYSEQLIKFKNYSRRKKIEYLQERYTLLRKKYTHKPLDENNQLKPKTIENQLIEFNNLIESLSKIPPKK